MEAGHLPGAYLAPRTDRVRDELEAPWLADNVCALAPFGEDHRLVDLGCGGGLGPLIDTPGLGTYVGVDFRTPDFVLPGEHVLHDLRDGLGPVGDTPFDLYVAGFGLASHLAPGQLRRLLGDIARHARPGALVAVEALGLFSLEWPRLWNTVPGPGRTLPYALERDVACTHGRPRSSPDSSSQLASALCTCSTARSRRARSCATGATGRDFPRCDRRLWACWKARRRRRP